MEEPSNYKNFDDNYRESVKYSISNGSYFKDAYAWYSVVYLRSIVDRTFFIFMSIIGIIIVYYVISIINMIRPLKEDIYITIREKDLTKYQTNIYDLSKNNDTESTDEDLLRYLIINYVKERESHNYKTANINDFNRKLEVIKNNSSGDVFNEFRSFMSSDNKNGPYYYFGKNIETKVEINSFKFIRVRKEKFIDRVKDYFNVKLMPIKAEVYYTLQTQVGDEITSQKRRAVVSFKFSGVEFNEKTQEYSPVRLVITDYKNYLVK